MKPVFRYNSILYKILHHLPEIFMDDIEFHAKKMGGLLKEQKKNLRNKFNIESDYDDYWYYRKFWNSKLSYLNRLRYLDFNTYLPDDILTKVDRVSMAVSLEVRVPLLSREIIEYCFSLPEKIIFMNEDLKGLIKKSYSDILPEEIIKKPKKGFSIPLSYIDSNKTRQEFLLQTVYRKYICN